MANPLVSLCCSTYSRPDLFEESLAGLLKQRYEPLEIVILIDGGNPESLKKIEAHNDPRLRWFATERPSGMIPAWNKVVTESKGKYFLYCADDDVLEERAVDNQVRVLEQNPNVGFCHGDFIFIDDAGRQIGKWQSHEGEWIKTGLSEFPRYLRQPKCCMQTCVVRRELWDAVGGWDPDAGYPGDNSLYLKLLKVSDVAHVAHIACSYRVRTDNPDSWLKNSNKVKEDVALARKHLACLPASLYRAKKDLERSVVRHFSMNALVVLADTRASRAERDAFKTWFLQDLAPAGVAGSLQRMLVAFRLEGLVARVRGASEVLRGFARNLVRRLSCWGRMREIGARGAFDLK